LIGLVQGWLEGRPRRTGSAAEAVRGLRPEIRARVKPFTRAFKKADEVEIKPKRERRAQQPAATAKKRHGNNGGNSGGNDGGKDKRKRPYHDTPSQSYTPSTPSRNHSHSNLPPAPWVDRETRDKREEKGLCYRCGGDHKAFHCPKYSRVDIRKYEDRQDRDIRQKPAADAKTSIPFAAHS
jgi:hypothetical protein